MASGIARKNYISFHVGSLYMSEITLSANGTYTNTDVNLSSVIPNGFSPLMCWVRATGSNTIYVYQCGMNANNRCTLQLRSISSSSSSIRPIIEVLCIRY